MFSLDGTYVGNISGDGRIHELLSNVNFFLVGKSILREENSFRPGESVAQELVGFFDRINNKIYLQGFHWIGWIQPSKFPNIPHNGIGLVHHRFAARFLIFDFQNW